jgi:hypothetical protein
MLDISMDFSKRKFRISPIEDEVSFRQLQKKHDHFIKFGNFVVFPTHNNHSAGTQYVKICSRHDIADKM